MSNPIATISEDIYGCRESFLSVLSDKNIAFDREAEFAIQVISSNDYATKIAISNRQSVVNAVNNVAAIGISLNPATKQAYLVPRDGKICLDISYMGLMDLAIASGSIRWAKAEPVYASDTFELDGYDKPPIHRFNPFNPDRGELIGVYVVAKTADGDYLTDTMTLQEVYAIRDRSSAWKAWVSKKKSCPWVTDEGEMVKKTIVKRASKYWPSTPRLDQAIHHLNTDGGEGLDLNNKPATDPQLLAEWEAKVRATDTPEALAAVWTAGVAAMREAKDTASYEALKQVVASHGAYLKQNQPLEGEIQ